MKQKLFILPSIFSYAFLYVHTTCAVFGSLLFAHLHRKEMLGTVIRLWGKITFWLILKKIHIYGLENIDKNKKYILLINHSSIFDIMAVMSIFPGVSWFGRERLLKIPVFGRILKMIDYIPMRSGDIRHTKEMLGALIEKSAGKSLAIFPEGTRTVDGNLGHFHKGFLFVQKATGRDLLPITLKGFFQLKPKTRFYIDYRTRLEIYIRKPLTDDFLKNLSDVQITEKVRDIIAGKL